MKHRSYKEHLIEKLKNAEYASAYLNACLEESFETKDKGALQVKNKNIIPLNSKYWKVTV